jgi:type IV pilus assembly protein PilO
MLSEARAWSNNFDEFLSRASRLRIDLAQLNEHIPPEANIAEVLKQISRVATISNVSGMQFAPQPLEQRGELWVQPIELQISGSYHGVGRFVSELAKLPRIVVARKINLIGKEKTSQQQTLVAELLVETYVRNP